MSHLGCLASIPPLLVADASVWINLVATGRIETHLRAIRSTISIAAVALQELERGRARGRQAAEKISELVASKLIAVRPLPTSTASTFMSLVSGPACDTLDDGEAATLSCALADKAGAVIDERKATTIAARRFPEIAVLSTVDLLLDGRMRLAIGEDAAIDSIFNALRDARMRVPEHHLIQVCAMLGPKRVIQCLSLPAKARAVGMEGHLRAELNL